MTEPSNKIALLMPKSVAKAAEFYGAQLGWRVFPLYEMTETGVCSCNKGAECKTPGKHPRISIPAGQEHPATPNPAQIKKWWAKWPRANIGVWLAGSNLLVLDIDRNDKKDGFKGLADIMAFENISELPKTLTCATPSGGRHLYFQFCEGVPNKANALGPGLDTWHSAHYIIVPPSNHIKGIYKWVEGGTETPAVFPVWLKPKDRTPPGDPEAPKRTAGRPAKERLDPNDREDVERLTHALQYIDATNRDLWVMIGFIIARAFDWSEAGFTIYQKWSAGAHNYDPKKTEEQYYRQSKIVPTKPVTTASLFEWARQSPAYKPWKSPDDRPYEIREKPSDELAALIDIGAVIHDFPIYQRSSKLVEIVPVNQNTKNDLGHWFPKGSYMLREVAPDQLSTRILPQKVKWFNKTMKGWKPGRVSKDLCAAFLNIGNWPPANKLRAFVQHPTLRDDGSLLSQRGYDKQSGLFLTEDLKIQVKDKPTKKDALDAIQKLIHPFQEFKFVDGSVSLVALISALFTVGVRHLFDEGVPLFAVDAPRQGSGKTKLVKAISILWFGRTMATTPYSSDHEEMKKHLASMLLNGDRVVLFDNVHPAVRVNDPTLNALLTSGRVTFRELGSQRMLEFDSSATFFMTGNNLKIVGDMIRRTIKMQIDPQGLHPMNRKFKIDPLESYIFDHRVELISAALTILTAFFQAGSPKPDKKPPIASFEKWSDLMRSLLMWLELDDLKECIAQGYEQDDESLEIEHLLRRLYEIPALLGDGLSSTMLLPLIESNKGLKDAMIPFMNERSSMGINHPRVITTVLSQVAKIPVDKKRLLRLGPVWVVREEE